MGWFSSSTEPSPAAPKPSTDGGYIAPDRSARQQCWDGRDSFFRCLDQHGIINSEKEDDKARKLCGPELKEFEKTCASSWVTYFKKRRVMEHQRDQTLKKLDEQNATPMGSTTAGAQQQALRGQ